MGSVNFGLLLVGIEEATHEFGPRTVPGDTAVMLVLVLAAVCGLVFLDVDEMLLTRSRRRRA